MQGYVVIYKIKKKKIALLSVYLNISNNHIKINDSMAIADDILFVRHVASWGKHK